LKGPTEEVISEAEITTAEVEAETEGIITGRKKKLKNYERYC
jgi:hypothetical protein